MKTFLCIAMLFLFVCQMASQSGISGNVNEDSGEPLPFANVLLLSPSDSSLVKGEVTDMDGKYALQNIPAGEYLLAVTMVGYATTYSKPFSLNGNGTKDMGAITAREDVEQLAAVEVVAKKPLFEQKIDRMVINVANTITSAGSTVLEVLERSPGVIVNRQSNAISMAGKSGVVVMINGKINYMPTEALVQLLAGMSSDNIEKIELITTPPANFDAEGNAGYINIVLKKNLNDGFNGSYTFSAGYGKGETGNANINFNYRKGKFNLYGDYAYLRVGQEQNFTNYRRLSLNNELIETDTRTDRFPLQNNHNARLGFDLQASPKTVLGGLLTSYDTKWTMDAENRSLLSSNGSLNTLISIKNTELNQWRHYGSNLNLQHTFNEGEALTLDADYVFYRDNNPNDYTNAYFDGQNNPLFTSLTRSGKITPIKIGVGKADYIRPFGEKVKMDAGVKGTISSFTNDVDVETFNGQSWVVDPELTAKYDLKERILAAYSAFDVKFNEKTSMKLGLRYEYTNSNLGSVEEPDIVDRQYGRFFPSFFVSHQVNDNNSMNFSFSRRITRPTFNDMAPFVIFIDPTSFFSGNPALQPAISNAVKADYRYKTVFFSVQYTREDSSISQFQTRVIPGTNKQLFFAENLVFQKTASFTMAFPVNPAKWWGMQFNFNGTWQQVRADYYGDRLTIEQKNLSVFSSQTFTLPKDFTFEITGFFNTGGLFGAFVVKPFGSLNAGIQKKFKDNGGSLRLGYDNILNTMVFKSRFDASDVGQYFDGDWQFSQPTIKISYSRNFGNNKMKGSRQRETGSEEERRRVN